MMLFKHLLLYIKKKSDKKNPNENQQSEEDLTTITTP
jgi:hypothetical protein